jgi:hypothetical protein
LRKTRERIESMKNDLTPVMKRFDVKKPKEWNEIIHKYRIRR